MYKSKQGQWTMKATSLSSPYGQHHKGFHLFQGPEESSHSLSGFLTYSTVNDTFLCSIVFHIDFLYLLLECQALFFNGNPLYLGQELFSDHTIQAQHYHRNGCQPPTESLERAYLSEGKRKGKFLCWTLQHDRFVARLILQNISGRDQEHD